MAAPGVYAAVNAVSAELARSGIAKARTNVVDDYKYRSLDDVLNRLAPLLAKHRLCVLPRVLEREAVERRDEANRSLFHVSLKGAFHLTSVDDGSSHVVEAFGEGLDPSDKATAKAMSAAYKSAMVQTFCIPFAGTYDADHSGLRAAAPSYFPEPIQGWEQWVSDIEDLVSVCETVSAIELVQDRNRQLLIALGRESQELYRQLGESFGARREQLSERVDPPSRKNRSQAKPRTGELQEEEHA